MAFAAPLVPLGMMATEAAAPAILSGLASLGVGSETAAALAPMVASLAPSLIKGGVAGGTKLIKTLGNRLFGGKKKKHARNIQKAVDLAKQVANLPGVASALGSAVGAVSAHTGVPASQVEGALAHAQKFTGLSTEKVQSTLSQAQKFASHALSFHDKLSEFNQPGGGASSFSLGRVGA